MSIQLSEDGELQVQGYLRFAKLKRDQHVREVVSTINDFKADHLRAGDMYNYKELTQMFTELADDTKKLMDKEIQNAYHTNALLVKILLSQAQAQGLELAVDTNSLENEFLLKQISSSEATALSRPASDFVRRNTQLGRLGTVATVATQDPAVVRERDALRAELQEAKERMAKLQEETTKVMRDRTTLNNQLNSLRDELAAKDTALRAALGDKEAAVAGLSNKMAALEAAGRGGVSAEAAAALEKKAGGLGGQLAAVQEELQAARNQLALKDKELRAASEALSGKLQESKQFLAMKQMMQSKSQEAAALRKRLEQYEPQSVPSADTA
ncbi:hypothetical protein CHLRE_06g252000v5 [Chlamydomonas reinhardtii]|uniref:Leucine zipper transcription factor-like protein 1 n=1 Tax=Chlamydomonas reinhardtii TaxID=3055 RepID=A8HYK1_CHLRE|nr:uncharacterized protein CHLRE_06g252000v5 [Chlamydomonas reinhardtii]ADF43130.1 182390p [Chlamydomonas reinhardtii]PNW81567.1 hypothetical protein CHLRE_06g252000v5 [Chlamydomonas reinhardtii]|eukprot:XP_001696645.1 flagellar associated protein [Chlamydomonas reinhardtii]